MPHIRIATRKSPLALWQAKYASAQLEAKGHSTNLVPLVTTGDKMQKGALADVSLGNSLAQHSTGKGLFVKEIQEALLQNEADIAVHSMKDLPVVQTPGLVTAIVFPRAAPEDVLILSPLVREALLKRCNESEKKQVQSESEGLGSLPYSRFSDLLSQCSEFYSKPVGTISARRQSLLGLEFGSSLMCEELRGNVETRLARCARGDFSAIVLAAAGLDRLGLFEPCNMYPLPKDVFTPAPAQGSVTIECRNNDLVTREVLASLACPKCTEETSLERLALWMLGGDCHTAIGAHWSDNKLRLFCHTSSSTAQSVFQPSQSELAELADLKERERGYFSSFFESLKNTRLAISLYAHLSESGYETLTPWSVT
jgi:hydroxymethylbilane synthase